MILVASLGFTQVVLNLVSAPAWVSVVAGIVVVIANLLPEIDGRLLSRRERAAAELKTAAEAAAAEQRWLGQIHSSLLFWPLPPNDTTDVVELGVRPSLAGAGSGAGSETYVPRDVDAAAALRLREQGVLLLVGEPGSGLTRTATELLHTTWPTRQVLAPRPPHGLSDSLDQLHLLEHLDPKTRLLVWLDRINDHHGAIVSLLTRSRQASTSQRVIATISSTHYTQWVTEQPELVAHLGEPVRVKRLPSPRELHAATAAYPGRDFTHGIGAAFTGTATLLARYTGGNTTCPHEPPGTDCTLTRTLIDTAIAWHSTGTPQPLTTTHATKLASEKVPGLDNNRDAHTDDCLTWARQRVTEGIALLTTTTNNTDGEGAATVAAHPELADILAAQTDPDTQIWLAALQTAADTSNSEAIGRIGYTANTKTLNKVAEQAWNHIHYLDEPAVAWLKEADQYSKTRHNTRARLAPLEKLHTLTEQAHGPDHNDVVVTITILAGAWTDLDD